LDPWHFFPLISPETAVVHQEKEPGFKGCGIP